MIRSIFSLDEKGSEKVIGFKLAKKTNDVYGVTIYVVPISSEKYVVDQPYMVYMLLESAAPRYQKILN